MTQLLETTSAYKIITGDKKNNKLSHAYCLICKDEIMLASYLKAFVKIIMCDSVPYCNECRVCNLIDKNNLIDCTFYPKDNASKIVVADVDELVSQTYIKPMECNKRVFVLNNAHTMNVQSQNKILKTLEEPQNNVFILMGATNEYALLPTIKSRVKRLEITGFSETQLFNAYNDRFTDSEKLKVAVSLAEGNEGNVEIIYNDDKVLENEKLCYDILFDLRSSKDVFNNSCKLDKDNIKQFLSNLKVIMMGVVKYKTGDEKITKNLDITRLSRLSTQYDVSACLNIIEKISGFERSLFFNANVNMVADGILLCILEEKYKWQKL